MLTHHELRFRTHVNCLIALMRHVHAVETIHFARATSRFCRRQQIERRTDRQERERYRQE